MQDAPTPQSPPRDDDESALSQSDAGSGDEETSTPAPEVGTPGRSRSARKSATPAIPQKRRAGRPPRAPRPADWDGSDTEAKPASDASTPKRGRGGFRGGRGFGGGRWRNRGGPTRATTQVLDKDGNSADVVNDEVVLPEDPDGETKVDKNGHLQDGREYRVRTFTILGRDRRLYMLSTEPARCIGFRDSYLFFQKHRQLYKSILLDEEKMDLIERDILPHSYKGRTIGVVTARSVFREFGAQIVIGGKKVVDDYQVAQCRANGEVEGELAVPEDLLPLPGQEYDRNRYVAWHGASSVYHSNLPTVPMQAGKQDVKKKRVTITSSNWMVEHSRAARYSSSILPYGAMSRPVMRQTHSESKADMYVNYSRFNSELLNSRRETMNGIYDIYTNQIHLPKIMQPSHARWEELPQAEPDLQSLTLSDPTTPPAPTMNGTVTPAPTIDKTPTTLAENATPNGTSDLKPTNTTFPTLTSFQGRNLATIDTVLRFPPESNLGVPGLSGSVWDIGPKGLCEVADDVMACLPPECLGPFLEAQGMERQWRDDWSTESRDGMRADVKITFTAAP